MLPTLAHARDLVDDDPSPFRLREVQVVPVDGITEVRQLHARVDPAYDFEQAREFDLRALDLGTGSVLRDVEQFGNDVRRAERRVVLRLVAASAKAGGVYETGNVTARAEGLSGSVRLLGGGGVADAVKEADVVEEVLPLPEKVPGVAALLVPLTLRPVVERVVDDLTVTWRRDAPDKASLVVRGRFFLSRAGTALKFTAPASRAPRTRKRS